MREKRVEDRLFCADLVEVRWQEGGRDLRRIGNLEDISQSGICLLMEKAIEPGVEVTVCCGGDRLTGVVRHCTLREIDWSIGVELHVFSQWSAESFRPKHLTDARRLWNKPALLSSTSL